MDGIYSEIEVREVAAFRLARYVVVSPAPEEDAIAHLEKWAKDSGLLDLPGGPPRLIGWNFPFVSEEQARRFGLRGYVAAYMLPPDFVPDGQGAEVAVQEAGRYAVITVKDPFAAAFQRIPGGYERIFAFLKANACELPAYEGRACFEFEEVCQRDGTTYMDIYVPIKG